MKLANVWCIGLLLGIPATANATMPTNTCKQTGQTQSQWIPTGGTIDIWVSEYVNPGTMESYSPWLATGLSREVLEDGVRKAIYNWNEEGGASIKIRYRGVTPLIAIDGALVITGRQGCFPNAAVTYVDAATTYHGGTIEFRKYAAGNCNPLPPPIPWTTSVLTGQDFVGVLQHELGHGVFDMGHPGDANEINCAYAPNGPVDPTEISIMNAGFARRITNFDKEIVQARSAPRSVTSQFWKTHMSSGASWLAPWLMNGQPPDLKPLYRGGSLSQRATNRILGFVYNPSAVQDGGTGEASTAMYAAGAVSNWYGYTAFNGTIGRPTAIATRQGVFGGADEHLFVYSKFTGSGTIYSSQFGELCYRRSTDAGVTFGAETCTGLSTTQYGMAATYDYNCGGAACFLVTYVTSTYQAAITKIPLASGSGSPVTTLLSGVNSVHGPSVACSNVNFSGDCILAYESTDSAGTFTWLKFAMNSSGNAVVSSGPFTQPIVIAPHDTPSVVYNADDQTYRLAVADAYGSFSYAIPWNGSAWYSTGNIYLMSGSVGTPLAMTSSSTEGPSFGAGNAFDNNFTTRWASQWSDPQWIKVDLGAVRDISRIRLAWETAYGSVYQIQVSNNNVNWTTVVNVTSGDGGIDDFNVSTSGRYVRMYGTARGTGWGYSLWEFNIFGNLSSGLFSPAVLSTRSIFSETTRPYAFLAKYF